MKATPVRLVLTTALLGLLAACERKPAKQELPDLGATLPNLIMPANATAVSVSGSSDALSIVLKAPLPAEQVVKFYRNLLNPPAWRLVSDARDSEGAYVLYAEQQGPPLWVRIWPDTAGAGSFVRLTGAVERLKRDSVTTGGPDSGK